MGFEPLSVVVAGEMSVFIRDAHSMAALSTGSCSIVLSEAVITYSTDKTRSDKNLFVPSSPIL